MHVFWNRVRKGPFRVTQDIYFGSNRRRVCNFLLVINSDFGPILPRFRDIAGFLPRRATPLLFHPNFEGGALGLDWRCCGSEVRRPKLITRVIIILLVQPIRSRYLKVTDRQTDGGTDGRLTIAIPRFALRASSRKNTQKYHNTFTVLNSLYVIVRIYKSIHSFFYEFIVYCTLCLIWFYVIHKTLMQFICVAHDRSNLLTTDFLEGAEL